MMTEGYNRRPYVHGAVDRLGIPGTRFVDGPRGCVAGSGTAFPVSMARGATWDIELEERIGEVIGREIRAQGGNFFGGVCINLPRHPAWGRIQETYGDDPYHLGEFGAALTRGTQKYVMACAKHYALNSMENARFTVDVTIDEATLHDVYLPHFKRAADEGVAAIMSAYNSVNGEWAGQNEYLLTEVLRNQWGWDGITVSDFIWGLRDGGQVARTPAWISRSRSPSSAPRTCAGSSPRADRPGTRSNAPACACWRPSCGHTPGGPRPRSGRRSWRTARPAPSRGRSRPARWCCSRTTRSRASPVLPLVARDGRVDRDHRPPRRVRQHGRPRLVGRPRAEPQHARSTASRAAFPGAQHHRSSRPTTPTRLPHAAREAQVAIVIAGFDARDEGEYVGSDTLTRPELLALFPPRCPTGASAIAGRGGAGRRRRGRADHDRGRSYGGDRASPHASSRGRGDHPRGRRGQPAHRRVPGRGGRGADRGWRHEVPAIVMMWYAGMEGGRALADVLTGAQNPSGRLPFSIPTSAEHLPSFDRTATSITYDRFHGQRLLDKLGVAPAFPHGFGLSYTTFSIDAVAAGAPDAAGVRLAVTVTNTGTRDGHHVVQVYGRCRQGGYAGRVHARRLRRRRCSGRRVEDRRCRGVLHAARPVGRREKTRVLPGRQMSCWRWARTLHDPARLSCTSGRRAADFQAPARFVALFSAKSGRL